MIVYAVHWHGQNNGLKLNKQSNKQKSHCCILSVGNVLTKKNKSVKNNYNNTFTKCFKY